MIRLFHVSDIHFGAEDRAALDWFAGVVAAEWPDAIVLTGDLTMRARAREFEAAAAWIAGLDRPVTIEVGNHDLPYFNLFARFAQPYRRYRALERAIEHQLELPGVAIVPLKTTARFQWRLNWSKGRVSRSGLRDALAVARAAVPERVVLVACHHPLIDAATRSQASTHGGEAALGALAKAGVSAVLSGHVHDPFDIAAGGIRLIGAGTLSERVRDTAPSFNEITIEGSRIDVRVREMASSDIRSG